ncbi:MAG: cation transporter [Elusimicrobia bacterium]|nr:cation transporter [Elusimicrobiota bacterium]
MKSAFLIASAVCLFAIASPSSAEPPAPGPATLRDGSYSAKVSPIGCDGCAQRVEQSIRAIPGVDTVAVTPATGVLQFTVATGKTVQVADLERAVKQASGAGVTFTLSDLKGPVANAY